jgi:hypothetical protein
MSVLEKIASIEAEVKFELFHLSLVTAVTVQ